MKPTNRFTGDKPENMELKSLVIFVIDNSAAMTVGKIECVNNFLNNFYRSIQRSNLDIFSTEVIDKIEFSIVTYNSSVETLRRASHIKEREVAPRIKRSTSASTCAIAAINEALDIIEERKEWYRQNRQHYCRPSIYLFSAEGLKDTESEEHISLRNRVLADYKHKRYYIFNTCIDSIVGSDTEYTKEICRLTIHSLHELALTIDTTGIDPRYDLSIVTPDTMDLQSDDSWLNHFDL